MLDVATEERLRVRYGETDMMGHAYYANYLFWFEQARGAWCRDRGFTYLQLEEMGYKLPVVEVGVRYRHEVRYDDLICIKVSLTRIGRASMRFEYQVVNETTGQACTEGHSTHALIGPDRRAVTVPPEVIEMVQRDPALWERLD